MLDKEEEGRVCLHFLMCAVFNLQSIVLSQSGHFHSVTRLSLRALEVLEEEEADTIRVDVGVLSHFEVIFRGGGFETCESCARDVGCARGDGFVNASGVK